jgi:hypothetical protein
MQAIELPASFARGLEGRSPSMNWPAFLTTDRREAA